MKALRKSFFYIFLMEDLRNMKKNIKKFSSHFQIWKELAAGWNVIFSVCLVFSDFFSNVT